MATDDESQSIQRSGVSGVGSLDNGSSPVGSSQSGLTQSVDPVTAASIARVAALRTKNPEKTVDALADILIRNRCLQVAGVGAATAGVAAIPSIGALASIAVGSMVDLDSTQKALTELVLDIATLYDYRFAPNEKQHYMMLALGLNGSASNNGEHQNENGHGASNSALSSAAEQLIKQGGQKLAQKATQRIASKSVGRAVPVVGVATSAGSNILMTYSAGQRARSYVTTGPASVGQLETSIRNALRIEELKLSDWTLDSLSAKVAQLSDSAINGFDQGAQKAGRTAGKAAGKFARFLRNATTPKS